MSTIFTIHAEPILASDFSQLTGDDFRFKSQAIFLFHTDKMFAYVHRHGYQYQFSGSQLMPLLTTIWHVNDNVTLSGLLTMYRSASTRGTLVVLATHPCLMKNIRFSKQFFNGV